jgi:hypothetical protein
VPNLNLSSLADGHRLYASRQDSEQDVSGSWLIYLTPLTAFVLAAALVFALRPPEEGSAFESSATTLASIEDERRATAVARYGPIVARQGPSRPQPTPYVVVLVSSQEDAQRLPAHLATPGAVNAVLVVASQLDERDLLLFLGELIELRRPFGLPDPVIIDLRQAH